MSPDRYWDKRATTYKAQALYAVGESTLEMMADTLKATLPGGDAVELACGPGTFTALYAERCRSVIATDIAPHMVEVAKKRLLPFSNVEVREADATATGLPAGSTDAVIGMNIIHLLPEPQDLLAEAKRLLRPGGRLILCSVTTEGMPLGRMALMGLRALRSFGLGFVMQRHDMPESRLRELLEHAGFTDVDCRLLRGPEANAIFATAEKPV